MAIEILPSEVVDQIAAGEVVERPSHMVKELVENSLDAGATEIAVDFSQGGRFVRVTDNGSGISPQDLPKAFLRFATSKIKISEDLWKLTSFGFRGEALASISSVSKVTIFSSRDSTGSGFRITSQFGTMSKLEPVSRSQGTTIIIEELFQNVPARLKFMKGDAAEAGQIKQVLKAMAMANPQVEFRVLQDGKLIFYWPATASQKERIEAVLDIHPLYEGTASRGRVTARAFFSDPHQVSRVSKSLWFFAQNRYVQDRSLQAAVMEAYRNLLMHGEYPYAVCFLDTDPSDIDVNIHPTKSQVKFVNPQEAFRAVQAAIRGVLEQAPWLQQNPETSIGVGEVPSVGFSYQDQTRTSLSTHSFQAGTPQGSASSATSLEAPLANPMAKSFVSAPIQPVNLEFSDEAFKTTQFRTKADIKTELLGGDRIEGHTLEGSFEGHFEGQSPADTVLILSPLETTGPTNERSYVEKGKNSSEKNSPPLIRHWSLLQVIGQAGLTYVVCQSEKGIVLIDQHAAHERVAFERLMNAWRGKKIEVQDFLFPLSIDLNEEKVEALRAHFGELEKLGIEIEELGPTTLGVKSAPAILKDRVLVEEIERFANEILDWGDSPLLEKAMGDICARMACHSVLRAGQSLSVPEMARLLEEMDEYPLSSFCPHGRPVSVTYSWPELEKDFGRRL